MERLWENGRKLRTSSSCCPRTSTSARSREGLHQFSSPSPRRSPRSLSNPSARYSELGTPTTLEHGTANRRSFYEATWRGISSLRNTIDSSWLEELSALMAGSRPMVRCRRTTCGSASKVRTHHVSSCQVAFSNVTICRSPALQTGQGVILITTYFDLFVGRPTKTKKPSWY